MASEDQVSRTLLALRTIQRATEEMVRLIESGGFPDDIPIELALGQILVSAAYMTHKGWAEQFFSGEQGQALLRDHARMASKAVELLPKVNLDSPPIGLRRPHAE